MTKPHFTNPRAKRARRTLTKKFYGENPVEKTPDQIAQEREDQAAADLKAWAMATEEVVVDLLKSNPELHPMTAHVMAADIVSARKATELVESGQMPAEQAYVRVGSFARWDWVLTMLSMGRIDNAWFEERICELWRGADPDDTNPAYLRLWKNVWRRNGRRPIRDGRPLPKGSATTGTIKVYRGGLPTGIRNGFAWTTDPKIARKFALGAGARVTMPNGVVITGDVKPSLVLAFITGRGESEVIVEPVNVQNVHTTGAGR